MSFISSFFGYGVAEPESIISQDEQSSINRKKIQEEVSILKKNYMGALRLDKGVISNAIDDIARIVFNEEATRVCHLTNSSFLDFEDRLKAKFNPSCNVINAHSAKSIDLDRYSEKKKKEDLCGVIDDRKLSHPSLKTEEAAKRLEKSQGEFRSSHKREKLLEEALERIDAVDRKNRDNEAAAREQYSRTSPKNVVSDDVERPKARGAEEDADRRMADYEEHQLKLKEDDLGTSTPTGFLPETDITPRILLIETVEEDSESNISASDGVSDVSVPEMESVLEQMNKAEKLGELQERLDALSNSAIQKLELDDITSSHRLIQGSVLISVLVGKAKVAFQDYKVAIASGNKDEEKKKFDLLKGKIILSEIVARYQKNFTQDAINTEVLSIRNVLKNHGKYLSIDKKEDLELQTMILGILESGLEIGKNEVQKMIKSYDQQLQDPQQEITEQEKDFLEFQRTIWLSVDLNLANPEPQAPQKTKTIGSIFKEYFGFIQWDNEGGDHKWVILNVGVPWFSCNKDKKREIIAKDFMDEYNRRILNDASSDVEKIRWNGSSSFMCSYFSRPVFPNSAPQKEKKRRSVDLAVDRLMAIVLTRNIILQAMYGHTSTKEKFQSTFSVIKDIDSELKSADPVLSQAVDQLTTIQSLLFPQAQVLPQREDAAPRLPE